MNDCIPGSNDKYSNTYGSYGDAAKYNSWGAVLHKLKANNIADGVVANMAAINPEQLMRANPAVIILPGQNWQVQGGDCAAAIMPRRSSRSDYWPPT
ncbi:hypothetical protein [Methylomusa anaerophila]|uniref:hypothetical protein n=1 Tax=Methylomusa anaerophila TaxID=1930071 RepID=UPI002D1FA76B|nr:hypothetical protein [Methylomusa anaerophila]